MSKTRYSPNAGNETVKVNVISLLRDENMGTREFRNGKRSAKVRSPDGKTGDTCGKYPGVPYSGKGSAFCSTCFRQAYGDDAHKAALAAYKQRYDVGPRVKCEGRDKGKVCPNYTDHESGIRGALTKTGMTKGNARELMREDAIISRIVAAFDKARQCLPCFKLDHPGHAKTLENITSSDDDPCVGSACESRLPRVPHSGGLCQSCLDAIVERNAAECPAIDCPAPPAKRRRC